MKGKPDYYDAHLHSIQRKLARKWSIHGAHHRNLNCAIQLPIAALRPGARILDLGCGMSIWVNERIEHLYEVHGLDSQEKSIEFCKTAFPRRHYRLGDVYALPYDPGSFDAVIMREVIEHLHDPAAAIREVRRVLKPYGLFIVTTPNYDSMLLKLIENTYNRFFGGTCKPYLPEVHPSKFHFETLKSLLEQHFEVTSYKSISFGISLTAVCSRLPDPS